MIDPTEIVAYMSDAAVSELLEICAGMDVHVQQQPRTGLVMMTVTDSFQTGFHPGEVLVTEARVMVEGVSGYGMVAGDNPRRALARAVAAATLNHDGLHEQREVVASLLERERSLRQEAMALERSLVASTKVSFDLMAGR
jgi:alpha-D-ribose 1-methylphosphonate 5-triphosphate synthase subunit PhnG